MAIGYTTHVAWWALTLGMGACVAVRGMAALGIRSVPLYFLVGGLVWAAIDLSGIHATSPASCWV